MPADTVSSKLECLPSYGTVVDKKVEKYNLLEVKNLLDDSFKLVLTDMYGYKEDFRHQDMRLVLGYPAAVIAAAIGYYTWKTPFPETKFYCLIACIAYFILYGAMLAYQKFVEKEVVYVGRDNNAKIEIYTILKDFDPVYKLKLIRNSSEVKQWSAPIYKYLDSEGHFVPSNFVADFSSFVNTAAGKSK